MAWIESHQKLEKHPKILELQSELGLNLNEVIGIIHRFWWWCVDYAENGDLTKYNDEQLSNSVGLNGKGKLFVDSMVNCGFIDREVGVFRVHDWWDYAGRYLQGKYGRTPEKWHCIQTAYKQHTNNRQYRTEQNQTEPTKPNQKNNVDFLPVFEELWAQYPNKDGKKHALRHFTVSVKDNEAVCLIRKALVNYLSSDRVKNGYVKNGSTWFNSWQDWVNYMEPERKKQEVITGAKVEHGKYAGLTNHN